MSAALQALGGGAAPVALAVALVLAVAGLTLGPMSIGQRLLGRYLAYLRSELGFLHSPASPAVVAALHLAAIAAILGLAAAQRSFAFLLLFPLVAASVPVALKRRRIQRVLLLEQQLAGWLMTVASALKAAPSIGDALQSTQSLVKEPIREEILTVLNETALGVPLDVALRGAAERVGSRRFSSVIACLLIARRSGGRLPEVLKRTAATFREMQRLEGVVRTKTAEGRAQALPLAFLPFGIAAYLHYQDSTHFSSLWGHPMGRVIFVAAGMCWLASFVLAQKILDVDI